MITFKKNKKKQAIIVLLLMTISVLLLIIGFNLTTYPSDYIYWFFPNKQIVFLFGVLSYICSLILITLIYFNITNKNFYIEINKEGVFLGIMVYKNKFIRWKDIQKIEIINRNNNKFISIKIYNTNEYLSKETGVRKLFFTYSLKLNGTPYLFNTLALDNTLNQVERSLQENFEKYKQGEFEEEE